MNKGSLNKILIAALLIIWSLAGYRIIGNMSDSETVNVLKSKDKTSKGDSKISASGSFNWFEVSRDPFLDIKIKNNNRITLPTLSKTATKKPNISIPNFWPQIEYFGYVQNKANKQPLVLLKIDDTLKRVRQGQTINGLIIAAVFNDSISIRRGNENKFFKKN